MWNYTDKVKEHFLNPRNVGVVDNPDGVGEVGSLACGDVLKLTFKLDESKKIKDAKFQTFGCASAIASSSALTEMLLGKTLKEAEEITNQDIADYLGGLPEEKIHCSVMGRDALRKAILSYKGILKKSSEENVVCECNNVTDKQIKEEVIKNKLKSLEDIFVSLNAGTLCGNCHDKIKKIIKSVNGIEVIDKKKIKLTTVQKVKMIDSVLEKVIKPALMKDGGNIDLIDVNKNYVYLKLRGACASCSKSKVTLKHYVETKLRDLVSSDLIVEEV